MEQPVTLADAIAARTAAYAEEAAARDALDECERRLKAASRDVRLYVGWDPGLDPVQSATLRGREAIAGIRREQARERLREARRDLQRARQLSEPQGSTQ